MVTLSIFTHLDYAHMCAFMSVTATYRLLPGVDVRRRKTMFIDAVGGNQPVNNESNSTHPNIDLFVSY